MGSLALAIAAWGYQRPAGGAAGRRLQPRRSFGGHKGVGCIRRQPEKEQLSFLWATGLRAACWRASELACGNHSSAPPARTRQPCAKANMPAAAIASECTHSCPALLPCGMQGCPAHITSNR